MSSICYFTKNNVLHLLPHKEKCPASATSQTVLCLSQPSPAFEWASSLPYPSPFLPPAPLTMKAHSYCPTPSYPSGLSPGRSRSCFGAAFVLKPADTSFLQCSVSFDMLPPVAIMTIIKNLPEAAGALNFEALQSPWLFEEKQLTSPALPGLRALVDKLLPPPPRCTVYTLCTPGQQ